MMQKRSQARGAQDILNQIQKQKPVTSQEFAAPPQIGAAGHDGVHMPEGQCEYSLVDGVYKYKNCSTPQQKAQAHKEFCKAVNMMLLSNSAIDPMI
jgi:hypothetical protein